MFCPTTFAIVSAAPDESATGLPVSVLVALGAVEICLLVLALVRWARTPADRFTGNRWVWLGAIIILNFVGPICFLLFGRRPALVETGSRPAAARPDDLAHTLYGDR